MPFQNVMRIISHLRIMAFNKRWSRSIVLTIAFSMLALLVLGISITNDCYHEYAESLKPARTLINPPRLTENEKLRLIRLLKEVDKNKNHSHSALEKTLSSIVQNQIEEIQRKNCTGPNFICGHYQDCGFGCQIHHRAACVMMSYLLNMPLIHDEDTGWSFSKKWTHAFLPIGSQCFRGPNTYIWTWERSLYSKHCSTTSRNNLRIGSGSHFGSQEKMRMAIEEIQFPLINGFSVSESMGSLVEKISKKPFLWWIGQFVKYTTRLNPTFETIMKNLKDKVEFASPIVGIHVRRTDKIIENLESHHELQEYFQSAEEFFQVEEHKQRRNLKRRIFVASDDSEILQEAEARYPSWDVRGFPSNQTLSSQDERVDALDDIIRDVLILSECHYVICGLTSNVCRLLLEIINSNHENPEESFRSLDGKYSYVLQGHTVGTLIVTKIYDH